MDRYHRWTVAHRFHNCGEYPRIQHFAQLDFQPIRSLVHVWTTGLHVDGESSSDVG